MIVFSLLCVGWKGSDDARRVCLDFLLVVLWLGWCDKNERGLLGTKTFFCLYFWILSLAMFAM